MKKQIRMVLGFILLAATIAVFAWYMHAHPEILRQLKQVKSITLVVLLGLYAVFFAALVAILQVSVRMYQKNISIKENFLLSAYSSLINFFGPGQSGPGLRAIYLKRRHNLGIKQYIFATLLYYACYAVISACMMFIGSRSWWQTTLFVLAVGGGSALILGWYARKSKLHERSAIMRFGGWMFLATLGQLLAQVAIYFVEIHAITSHVSFGQIVTYTGAANFALFAALTPGAIGIREAFLVFTHNLHHISNNVIVTANVIDRAAYLVFLGLLFVVVLSLHAGKKFKLRQMAAEEAQK
ncbi:MAG: lysylphosphatidylglycerol synthase domain-containing protein [Candidatus Saccharibacteria bacterium]